MINDNMLVGVAKLSIGEAVNIPTYLAFGSTGGILTATDTVTSGEFDRVTLNTSTRDSNIAKFTGTRSSASANNEAINVVGVWNGSSSSDEIWTNTLVASLIHTTNFDVEIEQWVRFERKT